MMDLIQEYLSDISGTLDSPTDNEVLWFMAWIVLGTLVAGIILSLADWWLERRSMAMRLDGSHEAMHLRHYEAKLTLDVDIRFSLRLLASWHPPALLLLSVISATSLWLGWHVVVLPLAAAAAVSYLWHFELRQSGVRWAAVYSLTSWVLPYLGIVCTIILFRESLVFASWEVWKPDRLTWEFHWQIEGVTWSYEMLYHRLILLERPLLAVIATWSLCALMASLLLAQSRRPLISPALTAAASCPVALCYWFVNPWAIPLGAFSMVLLGHAMSRERRLPAGDSRELGTQVKDGHGTRTSESGAILRRFLPFIAMAAIVALTIVVLSYGEEVFHWIRGEIRVYELHGAWYYAIRTVLLWMPLFAIGAVGYFVLRRITTTAQAAPYVATALLVSVLLDSLITGVQYFDQYSWSRVDWSDLRWPPDVQKHFGIDSYHGPRLIYPDVPGMPLALSYLVAVAVMIAICWQAVRGTLSNYGGLLCGMAWIAIVYWAFEFSVSYWHTWSIALNDFLLANLVIAAVAMFAMLYWGFGPGSIRACTPEPDSHAQGATWM